MKKIKETYLLFLIVIGLISLSLYSTYALFTASTTIQNVVGLETTLSTDSNIIEYEMVTVAPGEDKIIEVKVNNNYGSRLYYGVWYEILKPLSSSNVDVGLYTEQDDTPSSGQIPTGTELTLLIGISNGGKEEAIVNVGTIGSVSSNLNLSSSRKLIPSGWIEGILVTADYLDDHSTTITENVSLDFSYTGAVQPTTLYPGTYKLEVWGAQGGSFNTTYVGGKGGYSYGTLTLTETTPIYVYVGGKGTDGTTKGTFAGGFNGGGDGYTSSATYDMSGGGGGSDIRLGTDSLYARVIVAGGGGGAGSYSASYRYSGGAGGGTSGIAGSQYTTSYKAGLGGSSTSAGTSYYGTTANSTSYGTPANFGNGGSAGTSTYVAGGGGGWYGGGYARRASGGGGSGYVYTSSTASQCPTGCLLTSKYYLTDAQTKAGNTSFTDFSGSSVTGHSGDGAARISGTGQVNSYTIPTITGMTELNINRGINVDLNTGVSINCETGKTGCSLVKTSITDTSILLPGTHTIYYVVKSTDNIYYKYPRTINVTESITGSFTTSISDYQELTISNVSTNASNYSIKYAKGAKDDIYFTTSGTDITSDLKIETLEDGIYSIALVDKTKTEVILMKKIYIYNFYEYDYSNPSVNVSLSNFNAIKGSAFTNMGSATASITNNKLYLSADGGTAIEEIVYDCWNGGYEEGGWCTDSDYDISTTYTVECECRQDGEYNCETISCEGNCNDPCASNYTKVDTNNYRSDYQYCDEGTWTDYVTWEATCVWDGDYSPDEVPHDIYKYTVGVEVE